MDSNAAITAYESDGSGNLDQQLWYLGSSSSGNEDVTLLNRRNAELNLGTSGSARITILGNGNVGIANAAPATLFEVGEGSFNVTIGGNVGIGTTAPSAKLDIDGAVTFIGGITSVEDTISGAGNRFMWIPSSSAIRAGHVDGTEWDTIGDKSVAFGFNTVASGVGAVVSGGFDNVITEEYGTIGGGYSNKVYDVDATIGGGFENIIGVGGNYGVIPGGRRNYVSGIGAFAAGRRSSATASGVFAISDSQNADFLVSKSDVFGSRFQGGYWITGGSVTITSNEFGIGGDTFTVKAGKVGIGTTNPLYSLHVGSAAYIGDDLIVAGDILGSDGSYFVKNYEVKKSSDEAVYDSAALQADDDLLMTGLTADTTYHFHMAASYLQGDNVGAELDWDLTFTNAGFIGLDCTMKTKSGFKFQRYDTSAEEVTIDTAANDEGSIVCDGQVVFVGAGAFALNWAQNAQQTVETRILRGSHIEIHKEP